MKTNSKTRRPLFPLRLNPALLIEHLDGVVQLIIEASDEQLAQKDLKGEAHEDFALSCDALNFWRVYWRCQEEAEDKLEQEYVEMTDALCKVRCYESDEFEMALAATKERVRVPYGLDPLELAIRQSNRNPVRLLKSKVSEGSIQHRIAAIAHHLQEQQKDKPILLPIDALREVLAVRKVVVSGAVMKLMQENIIEDIGESYHTGKARQFRFIAKEGIDFEYVNRR